MFSLMPFGFLFLFVLLFGSILSLSSLHWLPIWAGLEINLMGFIPIVVYRGTTQETESGMKYFIAQALGSGMLMAGSLLSFSTLLTWETISSLKISLGMTVLIFGLMLKLGSFPFHFWLPSVMAGISWLSCLLLTTWQKLAPLFILMSVVSLWPKSPSIGTLLFLILLTAGFSSLIGGIGGLNQTQIRALLAYSSIGHVGWMLFCAIVSPSALKIYFIIYFVISICLFMTLWTSEKSLFSQLGSQNTTKSNINEISLVIMLLSLGGMPPLLGFIGKWLAISSACFTNSYFFLLMLLSGSLISLFYYLSLLFSLILLSGSSITSSSKTLLYLDSPSDMAHTSYNSSAKTVSFYLIPSILILNLMGGILIAQTILVFDFF